jgi:hypothetical protein
MDGGCLMWDVGCTMWDIINWIHNLKCINIKGLFDHSLLTFDL